MTTPLPITIDLGDHALDLRQHLITIASHCTSEDDPISECVQLSEDEAYRLYTVLHARFQAREALLKYREEWRHYCALDTPQRPFVDTMHCTGCGDEHLVAHLSDSGCCAPCCRQDVQR